MLDPIPDHSPEWYEARIGCWTASRAPDFMDRLKDGSPGTKRCTYIAQIANERRTGKLTEFIVTAQMQRGTELEPVALKEYGFDRDVSAEPGGFFRHPGLPRVGASPDGLVGDDGLVEVKCPVAMDKHSGSLLQAKNHKPTHKALVKAMKSSIAEEYRMQGHWQLWVTGRQWLDFVSFAPQFGLESQLAVIRIERDEALYERFAEAVADAEAAVAEILDALPKAAA